MKTFLLFYNKKNDGNKSFTEVLLFFVLYIANNDKPSNSNIPLSVQEWKNSTERKNKNKIRRYKMLRKPKPFLWHIYLILVRITNKLSFFLTKTR